MPTANQYRSARQLLGLTQRQVARRMGISMEGVRSMESLNDEPSWRSHRIFYDCWLREYARHNQPELLTAIDSILDNAISGAVNWLKEPDPRGKLRYRPVILVEEKKQFDSVMDCGRYLYPKYQHEMASPRSIAVQICECLNGRKDHWRGYHFKDATKKKS